MTAGAAATSRCARKYTAAATQNNTTPTKNTRRPSRSRSRNARTTRRAMDPDATEGDLREAEALFEEGFRMSRQILGAAHPETKTKQNTLSQIRKKLADPDRYTGVVCTTATY